MYIEALEDSILIVPSQIHHPLHLLIIDPQNDFCDLPEAYRAPDPATGGRLSPALPVPGAHADMQRLARFMGDIAAKLDAITLTLDSHHRLDIAHPAWWQDASGLPVPPFTIIGAEALRAGQFRPRDPAQVPRCQAYLDALEAGGRYQLMVWPVHCEIGTWGHAVHADVQAACSAWEESRLLPVRKILKGSNPWTEHYSALQAEVPDAADPDSQFNQALMQSLATAGTLLVAGEASSHCVKATLEHLVAHWPADQLGRIVLLSDCMSPVAGFEAQSQAFLDEMQARGLRVCSSGQWLAEVAL